MSLKLKEENKIIPSFESLMKIDSIVSNELFLLDFNIRREVINVLDSFLSFLMKYENWNSHNMISLMLDPRFKSLRIISSFVGRVQGVVLVKEYDRKTLYPMLVKCHEHLHPLVRLNRICANQEIFEQDYNLDIFEQIASTNEPVEELVKELLMISRDINWMLRTPNVFINDGKNMNQCFLQLNF
jgi:hypothetical protein